jgi:hypothetical protein
MLFGWDEPDTDTVFAGYPAERISGSSKSRIPDILPNFWLYGLYFL